jgi:hypothetical protein
MSDFENRVIDSLGRIEENQKAHTKTLDDHEDRIRRNERFLQWIKGVTGVTLLGSLGEIIKHHWHRLLR